MVLENSPGVGIGKEGRGDGAGGVIGGMYGSGWGATRRAGLAVFRAAGLRAGVLRRAILRAGFLRPVAFL